ncbi:MAG: DUF5808 domain-containing protein [Solirubrobacterales bacterium]
MNSHKWTNEEIEEYRKIHGMFFYCNNEDSNFLVPKASGFGKTVNFANPVSWVLIAGILIFIILRKF